MPKEKKRTHFYIPYLRLRYGSVHTKLLLLLFLIHCSTHMQDLKEVTQEVHYENFRAAQLANENSEDLIDASAVNGTRYVPEKTHEFYVRYPVTSAPNHPAS